MKQLFWIYIAFAFCTNSYGQTINTDSLFQIAKQNAVDKKFTEAQTIMSILVNSTQNKEYDFYYALVLGWNNNYKESIRQLQALHSTDSANTDYLKALANVSLWAGEYQSSINYADLALKENTNDSELLLTKAKSLDGAKRYKESADILKKLLAAEGYKYQIQQFFNEVERKIYKNRISTLHTFDVYDTGTWYLGAIEYQRKYNFGDLLGRVNYFDRNGATGYQYEVDLYPRINAKRYFYLNAGISNAIVFPKTRAGIEYYDGNKKFEYSAGIRYLGFSTQNIYIYTGTLGYYYKNYWFSFRPFLIPQKTDWSKTYILQARRYLSTPQNWVGIQLINGNSPDDARSVQNNSALLWLQSYEAKISLNWAFSNRWSTLLSGGYEYEERISGNFINRYIFELFLSYNF